MTFHTFELERWQSTWENRVHCNLSESGVHPLSISDLLALAGTDLAELAALRMVYSQSDGTEALRRAIAELYPGATPDHVTVTVGSSEANFITCWTLIRPGDHVVVVTPMYMQTHGLARNFGASVSEVRLCEEDGWTLDLEALERAVRPGTKLVVVTNPNNPTGQVLTADERRAIVDRARAAGAWLLADEVYQGAERDGRTTPSFWGDYERTVIVNGLSKAYGLPGLRIGWIVSPPEFKDDVVRRHDYTVIGPTPASDYLARLALAARPRILARTRGILNENYPLLEAWLRRFGDLFSWHPPRCGAICFARYASGIPGAELVERIRVKRSILLVPGEHFGFPYHVRFGYGNERAELEGALDTLARSVEDGDWKIEA